MKHSMVIVYTTSITLTPTYLMTRLKTHCSKYSYLLQSSSFGWSLLSVFQLHCTVRFQSKLGRNRQTIRAQQLSRVQQTSRIQHPSRIQQMSRVRQISRVQQLSRVRQLSKQQTSGKLRLLNRVVQ